MTVPAVGLNHPANPQAVAAPSLPSLTIPEAREPTGAGMQGMQGMDHGSMDGMNMAEGSMKVMDHGAVQGMPRSSKRNMKGMDHGSMQEMDHGSMQGMDDMERMEHEEHGTHGHGDEHGPSAAGQPGDKRQVDRTIDVTAHDTMRYQPQFLELKPGETIRFIVTNAGKIRHEFMIGTREEQREHEQMMQQMPNMVHEDPNSVTLKPGETKPLVWQFSNPGVVEFACHVPGHYPAGMVGKVQVASAGASSQDQPNMKVNVPRMDHSSMKDMENMKGTSGKQDAKDMERMEGGHHAH
ncbi:MAG: plastocyanin/azurin family copper-binding protein [Pseudomonadota bacterium]|nr:plastocyanin/azurin family copper-binding protein [Pseudomonadota bacterium]